MTHLLKNLLFDDAGHRMIATHATKACVRYRYYVSQPGLHGEARTVRLGSVSRVPAPEIEQAIVSALQKAIAARLADRRAEDPTGHFTEANRPINRSCDLVGPLAKATVKTIPKDPYAAWGSPERHPAGSR